MALACMATNSPATTHRDLQNNCARLNSLWAVLFRGYGFPSQLPPKPTTSDTATVLESRVAERTCGNYFLGSGRQNCV